MTYGQNSIEFATRRVSVARLFLWCRLWLLAVLCGAWSAPGLATAQPPGRNFAEQRETMVKEEIVGAGIKDKRVIESVRTTPRHEFVPAIQRPFAYFDMALPIGEQQTISPPFVVAYMTEQLEPRPEDKVLEIGTGSGYQAAILSPLVKEVYSIEIVKVLGERAAGTLRRLKYKNVFTKVGDGYKGWAEHAPFDKIIVTCSPEDVPEPLVDQLREGGRMIVPLGERYQQSLYLLKKEEGKLVREALLPTMFVPMTGAAEDQRQILPDPNNPKLVNGGFESAAENSKEPLGWYYQRQLELRKGSEAKEGEQFIVFSNKEPGRGSQALQAFGINGREIGYLIISAWARGKELKPGPQGNDLPGPAFSFFDKGRKTLKDVRPFGGNRWRGSFDWVEETVRVAVPEDTADAILRIGLNGATGELSMDGITITPVPRKK